VVERRLSRPRRLPTRCDHGYAVVYSGTACHHRRRALFGLGRPWQLVRYIRGASRGDSKPVRTSTADQSFQFICFKIPERFV